MLSNVLAAVAASALAHPPVVEWSFLSAAQQWNRPCSLPAGVTVEAVVPVGLRRVLVHCQDNRNFLADGASAVEVCVTGTQIPGQPAGVRWGTHVGGNAIFLRDRPPVFTATATGPGFSDNEFRGFFGDPGSRGPFSVLERQLWAAVCTPSGLVYDAADDGSLRIGPFDGERPLVVPPNFTPPGRGAPIVSWVYPRNMNSQGQFAGVAVLADDFWSVDVVSAEGFREILRPGAEVPSDRGPLTVLARPASVHQPMADGSVLISGLTQLPEGPRTAAYLLGRDGNASVIAVEGDHAPACPRGFSLSSISTVAAARSGRVLWAAGLRSDGAAAGTAFYVFDGARSRLILRSGAPVYGGQAAALPSGSALGAQINDDGSVLLASLNPSATYLYTPEAGTVEILGVSGGQRMIQGTPVAMQYVFPRNAGGYVTLSSGGDDTSNDYFSDDRLAVLAGQGSFRNVTMPFGLNIRLADPGCRPDYDLDGAVSFSDYAAFVGCFEGGACPNGKDADFNNDGFADFFDVLDYIDAFEHGC